MRVKTRNAAIREAAQLILELRSGATRKDVASRVANCEETLRIAEGDLATIGKGTRRASDLRNALREAYKAAR